MLLTFLLLTVTAIAAGQSTGAFTAAPDDLIYGVTPSLTLLCDVPDSVLQNSFRITSIEVSRNNGGTDQPLASIDVFDAKIIQPGSGIDHIDGQMGLNQANWLEVSWLSPDLTEVGRYKCEVHALDFTGLPTTHEYYVNVTGADISKDQLAQKLIDLQAQYDNLTVQTNFLASQNQMYVDRIQVLSESLKGHKICDSVNLPVGQYDIALFPDDGRGQIQVICDVVSPGEVWTVFHRRFDGSVDFDRRYTDYQNGFGSLNGEYWLGLDHVRRIMASFPGASYKLRVDLVEQDGTRQTKVYPTFDLSPAPEYVLTATGYDDQGKGMTFSSGSEFSTFDHGVQTYCAHNNGGGWWYDNCAFANLNGQYGTTGESSMKWGELPAASHPLRAAQMKFKKV